MGAYSKLHDLTYQRIRKHFPKFTIRENVRPEWLISSNHTKLELDLYIEEINTAIEIQGAQHYQFTPHFHKTYDDFKEQQKRDREKKDLCYGKGIKLIEISTSLELDLFIANLLQEKKHKRDCVKKLLVSDSPVGYLNQFCERIKNQGMRAYKKQIEKAVTIMGNIDPKNEVERSAITETEKIISEIVSII